MTGAFAWFVVVFAVLSTVRLSMSFINGEDPYYHLRVAASLHEQGTWYIPGLPWTRMSVFHAAWGDKEWLFHVLIMPFATGDLLARSQLMLSALNALLAGLLAYVGIRWAGRPGWMLPLIIAAVSSLFLVRMQQLRPHHLSILLLLSALHLMAARRHRWLGVVAVLYSLSYTAWQVLPLLCLLCFLVFGLLNRSWRAGLVLWPLGGIALGILLHPGFPDNVLIWKIQNVDFFRLKSELSVAKEFNPLPADQFILYNVGGLALLALATAMTRPWRRWRDLRPLPDHEIVFLLAAGAFGFLYLRAIRFAEYGVPFVTLAVFLVTARLSRFASNGGGTPARWRSIALAVVAGLVLCGQIALLRPSLRANARRAFESPSDMADFSRMLPPGAKVAAYWDQTPYYIFAAPQAAYLNVLDPVFMEVAHPGLNAIMEDLFLGRTADVPAVVAGALDSEYLAFNAEVFTNLFQQVSNDPRWIPLFTTPPHRLYALDRTGNPGFP